MGVLRDFPILFPKEMSTTNDVVRQAIIPLSRRGDTGKGRNGRPGNDPETQNLPSGKHTKGYIENGPFSSLIYPLIAWWFSITMLNYQRIWYTTSLIYPAFRPTTSRGCRVMSFPFFGRLFGLANDAPLPDPDFKTKQALLLGVHLHMYMW